MLSNLVINLINAIGWKTNRKLLIIESDDWGTIRMHSNKSYERLLKKGYPVDQCAYNKYDMLESNKDIEGLMDTLSLIKDKNSNPAKFTLNNIVANPDFEKIKTSGFNEYFYEPFTETLKRYPDSENVVSYIKEGTSLGIFKPQFHGREHLNVKRWMYHLQQREDAFIDAYNEEMFTVARSANTGCRRDCLDSFGGSSLEDYKDYIEILTTGKNIFRQIWNFESESFIAPCFIWSPKIEKHLADIKIKYLQGTHVQRIPRLNHKIKIKRKYNWLGRTNKYGQIYLIRNVEFEPSYNSNIDWVNKAYKEISNAFRFNVPAIISTHRLNYIGGISEDNRSKNLKNLSKLLKKIVSTYPEVEFLSSDELGNLINSKN